MTILTEAQGALLRAMAEGNHIVYSEDGDIGWLWPSSVRLETFCISNAELQDLRDRRLMGTEPGEDEFYRFGPPDVLLPAGRAALTTPDAST